MPGIPPPMCSTGADQTPPGPAPSLGFLALQVLVASILRKRGS